MTAGPITRDPTADRPLPVQRAFVVQLHATAAVAQGQLSGRVEDVLSGQVAHFHTLDDRKYGFETSVIGPFRKGGADHLDDHLEDGPFDIENYFPTVHT